MDTGTVLLLLGVAAGGVFFWQHQQKRAREDALLRELHQQSQSRAKRSDGEKFGEGLGLITGTILDRWVL